jgi:hypothetical protein
MHIDLVLVFLQLLKYLANDYRSFVTLLIASNILRVITMYLVRFRVTWVLA